MTGKNWGKVPGVSKGIARWQDGSEPMREKRKPLQNWSTENYLHLPEHIRSHRDTLGMDEDSPKSQK